MSDQDMQEVLQNDFPEASIVKTEEIIEGQIRSIESIDPRGVHRTYEQTQQFIKESMHVDTDYGVIPGTGGKSLYKPGAEKLQRLFGLSASTELEEKIEEWQKPITADSFPLFHYRYVTKIWSPHGILLATCEGSCNSYESRYRWRKASKYAVPSRYVLTDLTFEAGSESEFAFAVDKGETTGQYGKPAEYWESWKEDIKSGKATKIKRKVKSGKEFDAWERDGSVYRIPNEDIHGQVNTIMKISQKRSYVGAIRIAANASAFFGDDMEEYISDVQKTTPIKDLVPNVDNMKYELVKYVQAQGKENAGEWIKELLDNNNVNFSLDIWESIVDLVDEFIHVD